VQRIDRVVENDCRLVGVIGVGPSSTGPRGFALLSIANADLRPR
jgi:hypothetical protein